MTIDFYVFIFTNKLDIDNYYKTIVNSIIEVLKNKIKESKED